MNNNNEMHELRENLKDIKHKIVVLSGKGGVGKSTVAVNLAVGLAMNGKTVGLLDTDIHGPSIPNMLGIQDKTPGNFNDRILPVKYLNNMFVLSVSMFLQNKDDAVIWRGPMKMGVIKQFLKDTEWGPLDYLIIDSPPGTGDEPLSTIQSIEDVDGAVIVTTPQNVSVLDVKKSISFANKLKLNILGIVENMSGFICPECNTRHDIFKKGGGELLAEMSESELLAKIPLEPEIAESGDKGNPFVYFNNNKTESVNEINNMISKILEKTSSIESNTETDK